MTHDTEKNHPLFIAEIARTFGEQTSARTLLEAVNRRVGGRLNPGHDYSPFLVEGLSTSSDTVQTAPVASTQESDLQLRLLAGGLRDSQPTPPFRTRPSIRARANSHIRSVESPSRLDSRNTVDLVKLAKRAAIGLLALGLTTVAVTGAGRAVTAAFMYDRQIDGHPFIHNLRAFDDCQDPKKVGTRIVVSTPEVDANGGANLRHSPNLESPVVQKLPIGSVVQVVLSNNPFNGDSIAVCRSDITGSPANPSDIFFMTGRTTQRVSLGK